MSAAKDTGRLEAFSDGVFAIAITLLALELKAPHLEASHLNSGALAAALDAEWPSYFAFITSFFTVLIMWVHHHLIFKLVRRIDVTLLFANGFLLMLVTVVPFPTAVVSEYLRTPAGPAACTFYAGFFVLISIGFWILLWAAFRKSVLDLEASACAGVIAWALRCTLPPPPPDRSARGLPWAFAARYGSCGR